MRFNTIALGIAGALTGCLLTSPAAQAAPVTCPVNPPPGYQVLHHNIPLLEKDERIPLPGNARGISFGQRGTINREVRPGDVVRVRVSGTVHYGGVFGLAGEWGPDGKPGDIAPHGDSAWPAPGLTKYAVFGSWNQNATYQPFRLGSDGGCRTVPPGIGDGFNIPWILDININDTEFGDNTKAFGVTIDWWQLRRT